MPPSSRAPRRTVLADFCGRPLTLSGDARQWDAAGPEEGDCLLLGLGPDEPASLPFVPDRRAVYWLECPETRRALPGAPVPPPSWREVSPEEAVALSPRCRRHFYRPGLRLAPAFWGPLLGRMEAACCPLPSRPAKLPPPLLVLPGDQRGLLHLELRHAAGELGWRVLEYPPEKGGPALFPLIRQAAAHAPALLLSVNLRGLDPDGRLAQACLSAGIPAVIWCVDNPWHLLSGARGPWWRDCPLCVTDAGFLEGLRRAGARRAFFLPLASAQHMWRTPSSPREERTLFVGRSEFPRKKSFFAAASVPPSLLAEGLALVAADDPVPPDVHWWHERLGGELWPGTAARRVGLGAEECSQARRAHWVREALSALDGELRLVGDGGWKDILPGASVEAPVDYYAALPELYGRARAVLNVTSLLLPHSLNQRHFDVWAAGGLLLSDATPGLEIFPPSLADPIRLRCPAELPERLEALAAAPQRAEALRAAWREEVRQNHTYARRLRTLWRLAVEDQAFSGSAALSPSSSSTWA